MITHSSETHDSFVDTFRIARRVGTEQRGKDFEVLRDVMSDLAQDGVEVASHAGMVAIDLLPSGDTADIQQRYPQLTDAKMRGALDTAKSDRANPLSQFREYSLTREVGDFDTGDGRIALGIPLGPEGARRAAQDRELIGGLLTSIVRVGILLPYEDEPYLTVGFMPEDASDHDADTAIARIERKLWRAGEEGPTSAFMFDAEVYATQIPLPEPGSSGIFQA